MMNVIQLDQGCADQTAMAGHIDQSGRMIVWFLSSQCELLRYVWFNVSHNPLESL
jgi:hypothetical protein